MNEQYAVLITGFPLFHGFTLDGARMLFEWAKSRSTLQEKW